MRSDTTVDDARDHEGDARRASRVIERELAAALDAATEPEVRFHLRQGLQLLEAMERRRR
jgi:ribosome-binding factor A